MLCSCEFSSLKDGGWGGTEIENVWILLVLRGGYRWKTNLPAPVISRNPNNNCNGFSACGSTHTNQCTLPVCKRAYKLMHFVFWQCECTHTNQFILLFWGRVRTNSGIVFKKCTSDERAHLHDEIFFFNPETALNNSSIWPFPLHPPLRLTGSVTDALDSQADGSKCYKMWDYGLFVLHNRFFFMPVQFPLYAPGCAVGMAVFTYSSLSSRCKISHLFGIKNSNEFYIIFLVFYSGRNLIETNKILLPFLSVFLLTGCYNMVKFSIMLNFL